MLLVKFDKEGIQAALADETLDLNEEWKECPEDFDPATQQLRLVKGKIVIGPLAEQKAAPHYLLWEYVSNATDYYAWPGDVPFDILGLYPRYFVGMGFRKKTIHYANRDATGPVVKLEYDFILDEGQQSLKESPLKISFMMSDGNWSQRIKPILRTYDTPLEKQKELRARRANIIDELKGLAAQMGISPVILELIKKFQLQVDRYVESGSADLFKAIRDDTTLPWLAGNLPNRAPARAALLRYLIVGLMEPT
jgi:hypothetical protein